MVGFEPGYFWVGSDRSVNCATITATLIIFLILAIWLIIDLSKLIFIKIYKQIRKETSDLYSLLQLNLKWRGHNTYIKVTRIILGVATIYSSVDSSAPTILLPEFKSQAHHQRFFQFVLLLILEWEKDEKKRKRDRDLSIFKKTSIMLPLCPYNGMRVSRRTSCLANRSKSIPISMGA